MQRLQLTELHELPWCPRIIRDGLTDFLECLIEYEDVYAPVRPLLRSALQKSGARRVVDCCSGAGGPWVAWQRREPMSCEVTLTDKFPNVEAIARLERERVPNVQYAETPVDALDIPPELSGFRTMFSAFHHFDPSQAAGVIRDAVAKRQPIGIFEFTERRTTRCLLMLLSPVAVWALTPRMRSLSWSKLFFTYLVPLIPLVVTIDGIISCCRTYTPEELDAIVQASEYEWESGMRSGTVVTPAITYLIGYPRQVTR